MPESKVTYSKEELLDQLDFVNGELATLYFSRSEASSTYRTYKSNFEIEQGLTLKQINDGTITTATKPTEKDKLHYTINRNEAAWTDYNEAKATLEKLDRDFETLNARRSIIQTSLNKRNE